MGNMQAGSMYGTTTKGVTWAREELERRGYETLVFHASGAGGRAMENLVRQSVIHGVLDMTIAEIGAHLVGGLHDAGPHRLEAMTLAVRYRHNGSKLAELAILE